MKTCTKCLIAKEQSAFGKDGQKKDGLSSHCRDCCSVSKKQHYIENKQDYQVRREAWKRTNYDEAIRYARDYRQTNKELLAQKHSLYRLNNKDQVRKRSLEYRAKNKDKIRITSCNYYQNNKERYRAYTAKRKAIKLRSTIAGFDNEIQCIYRNCPVGYEVDHIVPLQGANVCGFHVPWNLQYLTVSDNRKKGNRL